MKFDENMLSLILVLPSGENITHQAGGYNCSQLTTWGTVLAQGLHRELVGFLMAYFCGPPHMGWCYEGITEADARVLDAIMVEAFGLFPTWTVDRTRLGDSQEAWVWIKSGEQTGVLAWPNSD